MPKQKNTNRTFFRIDGTRLKRSGLLGLLAIGLIIGSVPRLVHAVSCTSASDCQQQINSLDNQSSSDKQTLGSLQGQAATYQGTVDQLQTEIANLQQQIVANQAEQVSLQQQITTDEQMIATKKASLADDIKTMYVDGQMSTIEELATSKNLSDYIDKEQYRTDVQDQLDDKIQAIGTLEQSLQTKKTRVDTLVANLSTQEQQQASAETQQQQLLGYNQQQQASYNQQISANSSSVSQLKARLSALNDAGTSTILMSGTCGGGYPATATNQRGAHWGCNYPQDGSVDNWNMDNRECVSYTAYMVATKYGISTSGWGNAYQWISSAESHGYTVDQTPAVGAIAIRDIDYSEPGDVGHAMYVAAVNGPDSITVDEYNEHYTGTFDERTFAPSSYDSRGGMYYIHFN